MTICEELQDWIPAYTLGVVPRSDRACIEEHLRLCPDCRRLAEEYEPIAELLAYAPKPVEPPTDLKWRVLAAIRAECQ